MAPDRHRRATELFVAAARLPIAARAAFLADACGGDAWLRAEVESLLAHDDGEESERFAGAQLPSPSQLLQRASDALPAHIGRYEVRGVLGRGGMGVVYRAHQQNPARDVAVKVLAPGGSSDEALRRFEREAAVLGRLRHPGIAQIFEAGTADSGAGPQPFFAMELVDGDPITEFCQRGDLDVRARLELMVRVCRAVEHAHQRGVVHRDLKPSNILVDADGQPKVLDFGVARLVEEEALRTVERTKAGDVLGTIAYMSPEQALGDPARVDARTDVHALGVIAYELLSGELPRDLTGRSVPSMLAAVGSAPPVPLARRLPRLRGDVDTILGKALAVEPDRRYASAAELAADLRRYLDDEPIAARPPSATYRARMLVRRHRGLAAGLSVAVLVLVAGATTSIVWALRAEDNARVASANARRAEAEQQSAEALSEFLHSLFVAASPAVARGQVITARDLVVRGHAEVLREDAPSLARVRIMAMLGEVERTMGEARRADEILPKAVADLRASTGAAGGADLAAALLALGRLRYDQGKLDDAKGLIEEARSLYERLEGHDSAEVAECLFALGMLAGLRARRDDALAMQREAAAIFERKRGADSPRLAMALDGIGTQLNTALQHDQAAAHFERAIAIYERAGDDSLAQLAGVLANLAIARIDQGRPAEAGPLFRRALAIGEQIYPPDHPGLIVRLTNLGTYCGMQGDLDEAAGLLRRALAIHEQRQLGDHRATAHTYMSLGQVDEGQGRFADARAAYTKALQMFERLLGPDALDAADVLESIGRLENAAEDASAAATAYERALRIRAEGRGAKHASLKPLLVGLQVAYRQLGRADDEARVERQLEGLEPARR